MTLHTLSIAFVALALTACGPKSDPDTFGGKLLLEGGDLSGIGEKWNDGQAMIANGRAEVEEGQAQIQRGNQMIFEGQRAVAEAERAYHNRINIPQTVTAPPVVLPQGAAY